MDGVRIYVPSTQSGLRGLYRYGGCLYAGYEVLLYSDEAGRVQVVQDLQGRAENLEALFRQFQKENDRQVAELNARYEKA